MYDAARAANIAVVAGSIIPFNTAGADQNARMHAVNDWIRAYAARPSGRRGVLRYPRGASPRRVSPTAWCPLPMDLHPSPDGYRRMATALEPAISDALAKAQSLQ